MKDLSFFERIREIGRMTPSEARIAEHMEQCLPHGCARNHYDHLRVRECRPGDRGPFHPKARL